jgi:PIN domain nuclease of toxin-antitoxin system
VTLLLDSHVVLWWLADIPRIPAKVRRLIEGRRVPILVSAVTAYELRFKERLGKVIGVPEDLPSVCAAEGWGDVAIAARHAEFAARLPLVHRDPWDRLLIAQARLEGVSLVSADPVFGEYGVEVVW